MKTVEQHEPGRKPKHLKVDIPVKVAKTKPGTLNEKKKKEKKKEKKKKKMAGPGWLWWRRGRDICENPQRTWPD